MVPQRAVRQLPTPGNQLAPATPVTSVSGVKSGNHASDLDVVRSFVHDVKLACDELYLDAFNQVARRRIADLILRENVAPDAAFQRLLFPGS